ncbi:MAG: hypothetical protein ACRDL6_00665 [Solirubrobacterales bacterium]
MTQGAPPTSTQEAPPGWSWDGAVAYCIDCSRELTAEAARAAMPLDADWETLEHAAAQARIHFELERDPDRTDAEIARLCRTSVLAARNARKRPVGPGSDPLLDPAVAKAQRQQPDRG